MSLSFNLLRAGSCLSVNELAGITHSLFGTINALNNMQTSSEYEFEWTLCDGTLIAQQRNSTIFPWDSDADIYLIFTQDNKPIAQTNEFLDSFVSDLKQEIDGIVGSESRIKWSSLAQESVNPKYNFAVRALKDSDGFLDVFILIPGPLSGTRLMCLHPGSDSVHFWTQRTKILPPKNVKWSIYGNDVYVNIPKEFDALLTWYWGNDWMIPNVDEWQLNCPNVNETVINEWMSRYDLSKQTYIHRNVEPIQDHSFFLILAYFIFCIVSFIAFVCTMTSNKVHRKSY